MWGKLSIFLLTAILVITSLSLDASGDINHFEDNFTYEGGGIIYLQDSAYFYDADASEMREMFDKFGDSDGYLSQEDIDAYNSFIIGLGINGQTNLFRLDGEYGDVEALASEFENAEGPVNSTEPWRLISHRNFHFEETSQVFHTFTFVYVTLTPVYDTHSNFTFEVPRGWIITNCTGLEEMNISSDKKIVEGLAPFNGDIKISFEKTGAISWDFVYVAIISIALIGTAYVIMNRKNRQEEPPIDNENLISQE